LERPPGRECVVGRLWPVFEFCVAGPAVSAQAKNKRLLRDWSTRVAAAARRAWPKGKPPTVANVEVYISEFSEFATADRDNMAKPVLDAMESIVYKNDKQVKHLHVEWCDIEGSYVVRYMSPVVAAALSAGTEFLWVRILRNSPRKSLTR
jgi:crossover junction endodeoxyribonuclease RusA